MGLLGEFACSELVESEGGDNFVGYFLIHQIVMLKFYRFYYQLRINLVISTIVREPRPTHTIN